MAPRRTTSSLGSQTSKDNTPSRTIGNVNAPPRNIEEVPVPSPTVEGITQVRGN